MLNVKDADPFKLTFLKLEQHFILPRITSIIVVQNLYDILFQYAITEEREQKIKTFIDLLEKHIKSKSRAPFSIPATDIEFLEEGLEELRLLNWLEMPVALFKLEFENQNNEQSYEDKIEKVMDILQDLFTCKQVIGSEFLYVYPATMTIY